MAPAEGQCLLRTESFEEGLTGILVVLMLRCRLGYNERVRSIVDAWGDMMDELDKRVMDTAATEGLLAERQPNSGTVKQLEAFMDKYGYRDGCGWWVQKKEPDA